jgi:uncharacterized membrane protein YcaP (DUF421 family)
MWRDMFNLPVPILEKVLRAVILYGFVIVALRVSGKRELAQLNPLDFTVLLLVANAIQNGIIGDDLTITGAVLSGAVLFAINAVVERSAALSPRTRAVVEGKATVLVRGGEVLKDALRHEGLSADEVLAAMQDQGVEDIAEVAEADLLPSGRIVVHRKMPAVDDTRHQEIIERLERIERLLTPPA